MVLWYRKFFVAALKSKELSDSVSRYFQTTTSCKTHLKRFPQCNWKNDNDTVWDMQKFNNIFAALLIASLQIKSNPNILNQLEL